MKKFMVLILLMLMIPICIQSQVTSYTLGDFCIHKNKKEKSPTDMMTVTEDSIYFWNAKDNNKSWMTCKIDNLKDTGKSYRIESWNVSKIIFIDYSKSIHWIGIVSMLEYHTNSKWDFEYLFVIPKKYNNN